MPEANIFNRRFILLLSAQTGLGFANSSFMMLPKFLATELDAGPEEIGVVVSVSAIAIVCFLIPVGAMIDRHGRKKFLIGGAVLMALTSVMHALVHEVGFYLYVLRILQALAFSCAYSAGAALCVDAAPPARLGQVIGLFGLSYIAMGAIAPAAVETVVVLDGWNAAFYIATAAATLGVLLSMAVQESKRDPSPEPSVALSTIAARPAMLRSLAVIGLLGVAFGCAFNFHQPYALSLGITELRNFFIANSAAAVICRIVIGPYIDRIGLRRISLVSLSLYAVVIWSMVYLDELGLLTVGLGMGVAHGLFYPAYNAMVLADSPAAERGRRLAIIQAALNLGIGGGGIALGWIAARWGYPLIFEISAAGLVVAAALILFERGSAEPVSATQTWDVSATERMGGI